MRFRLSKATIVLSGLLLIVGTAGWLSSAGFWPAKLSNLAWTEFESVDGSTSSIHLPSFSMLIEEMFTGYRREPTSEKMLDTSGAWWKVTLADTDGSKR